MTESVKPDDPYLDRIQTMWTLVQKAHRTDDLAHASAQESLLERYREAVYRYLMGAVRDPHAADELFQEFAIRFLEGRFRGADPAKGRFRDYVKSSLFNLVAAYRRKSGSQPHQAESFVLAEATAPNEAGSDDAAFRNEWRDQILARTWERLAATDRETGSHGGAVLRFKSQHPEMDSQRVAEELSKQLGRPMNAAGVRQTIHRAREKFAALMLEEIANSIATPTQDALAEEAAELGLLPYCEEALRRRQNH